MEKANAIYDSADLSKMTKAFEVAQTEIAPFGVFGLSLASAIISLVNNHPDADAREVARLAVERFRSKS